jgi:phage gpG-like protein
MKRNNFKVVAMRVKQAFKVLPKALGIVAKNEFLDNVDKRHGFRVDGGVVKKWPPLKSKKDAGRAPLNKTGRLKRAINTLRLTANSAVVGVDDAEVPYAKFHNEGVPGKLPQRKFVGESKVLNRALKHKVQQTLIKAFKK